MIALRGQSVSVVDAVLQYEVAEVDYIADEPIIAMRTSHSCINALRQYLFDNEFAKSPGDGFYEQLGTQRFAWIIEHHALCCN